MTMPCITSRSALLAATLGLLAPQHPALAGDRPVADRDRLAGSHRSEKDGWILVHLEGTPEQVGYQHGYLLGDEIADLIRVCKPFLEKTTKRDWNFYRQASEKMLWPKTEPEYQREIDGIVAGLNARGIAADRWDLRGPQRPGGASVLLRPLAGQEGGQDADDPRPGELQRVRRHGLLHEGRADRDGPQRLDELCGRDALEHHLRHHSPRRAIASSWTGCRASSPATTTSASTRPGS